MAGQQADSAAFQLASPGPGSSQYRCLDRPHPRGWEGSGRVHSLGDVGDPVEPTLGCAPLQEKKGQSMRVQAKVSRQATKRVALDAPWQELSNPVPSVSFGGDLICELRPVYTLFTPDLGGGGESRSFASRAIAAQVIAKPRRVFFL